MPGERFAQWLWQPWQSCCVLRSCCVDSILQVSERSEAVERLQQQLNALKQKTFKLSRLKKGERQGLLDSGATHPLRPMRKGEDVEGYKRVQVALADGQVSSLPISPGGAMVSADADIEPIIPMGLLTEKLGCSATWSRSQLRVVHPLRGELLLFSFPIVSYIIYRPSFCSRRKLVRAI